VEARLSHLDQASNQDALDLVEADLVAAAAAHLYASFDTLFVVCDQTIST
jgi:hypothetical protein